MNLKDYNFIATNCYILNDRGQVLLQKKARGFGKGKWNGPGGKQEPGETVEEAVTREVREETDLEILDPEIRGELDFVFPHIGERFYSYVFLVKKFRGEPRDLGEGELRWFNVEDIPLEEMWDDDRYWMPRLLGGEYVRMKFFFDENGKVEKLLDNSKIKNQNSK